MAVADDVRRGAVPRSAAPWRGPVGGAAERRRRPRGGASGGRCRRVEYLEGANFTYGRIVLRGRDAAGPAYALLMVAVTLRARSGIADVPRVNRCAARSANRRGRATAERPGSFLFNGFGEKEIKCNDCTARAGGCGERSAAEPEGLSARQREGDVGGR